MSALEELIREEIGRDGPVPFQRFMELALYHPEYGYYRRQRDPFGVEGDFYTNSQLQPVFGRLVAQQIARWREEMGRPGDFTVVEVGAGRGETLEEVRKALPGVRCVAVDRAGDELPRRFSGVIYSNELFDALPVHLVSRRGSGVAEILVDARAKGFSWVEGEPSIMALAEYVDHHAPGLAEGRKIEVNLSALHELERMATALEHGFVLTIDYGYTATEIARGRFPDGSLMSYQRHQAQEDVLREPGERDITSHTNFTALEARGREMGLQSMGVTSQAHFLLAIGEADQFETALAAAHERETLRLRMQLKSLLFGMGETFRVLTQRKP